MLEKRLSSRAALRQNPRVIVWVVFMLFTCIMWGYDGLAGGVVVGIPEFRRDFGYQMNGTYVLRAQWQSAFNSCGQASMFFGGLLNGWFAERVGCKISMTCATLISICGVFPQFFATRPAVFLVGKIITGFTLGMYLITAPTYISEISPTVVRGSLTAAINLSMVVGQLLCQVILRGTSKFSPSPMVYKALFAVQWGFAASILCVIPFMPESPWWLVRKGKLEKARKSLKKLYGPNDELIETRLSDIRQTIANSWKEEGTYFQCFLSTDRRRTLIAMAVFVVQLLSGAPFVLGYQTYFLQVVGIAISHSYTITCANYAFMLVGNAIGIVLCERVGRRPMFLCGIITLGVLALLIGITGKILSSRAWWAMVVFIGIWGFVYQATIGAVGWSIAAEVSTPRLRSPTQAIANMTSSIISTIVIFVIPFMVNPDAANLKTNATFIFAGLSTVCSVIVYLFFPELKGRSFYELDEMFGTKVKTRDFKTYKTGADDAESGKRKVSHIESTRTPQIC